MEKKKKKTKPQSFQNKRKCPKVPGPDGMSYMDHLKKRAKRLGLKPPKPRVSKIFSKYDL